MSGLNATQLAETLGLSKGRISQYVSSGKLDGCFDGTGRNRRFDLEKAAHALGKRLDPGQTMGNGAGTRRVLQTLVGGEEPGALSKAPKGAGAEKLTDTDPDRYQMARTQLAEEQARTARRNNAQAEGTLLLASEVTLQTRRLIAQEIAEFESVLRDGARKVADDLGVDFKRVRALLVGQWRAHRTRCARQLASAADGASLSEAEQAADI